MILLIYLLIKIAGGKSQLKRGVLFSFTREAMYLSKRFLLQYKTALSTNIFPLERFLIEVLLKMAGRKPLLEKKHSHPLFSHTGGMPLQRGCLLHHVDAWYQRKQVLCFEAVVLLMQIYLADDSRKTHTLTRLHFFCELRFCPNRLVYSVA